MKFIVAWLMSYIKDGTQVRDILGMRTLELAHLCIIKQLKYTECSNQLSVLLCVIEYNQMELYNIHSSISKDLYLCLKDLDYF